MRGYAGFAGPMIMLPVMAILFGPVSAVVTIILIDLIGNVVLLPDSFRQITWRVARPLILGTAACVPFGSYLLLVADPQIMKQGIIVAVIGVSMLLLFGWRYRRTLGAAPLFCVGVLAGGFLSAAFIGAIVPIFLYAGPDSAAKSRANIIIWAFTGTLMTIAALIYGGAVSEEELWRALILAPFYLAAIFAGTRLFRGIDETLFRRTVLIFLICGSVAGIVFF